MYVDSNDSIVVAVRKGRFEQLVEMGDGAKSLSRTRQVDKTERTLPKDFADAVGVRAARSSGSCNSIVDDVGKQAYYVDSMDGLRLEGGKRGICEERLEISVVKSVGIDAIQCVVNVFLGSIDVGIKLVGDT